MPLNHKDLCPLMLFYSIEVLELYNPRKYQEIVTYLLLLMANLLLFCCILGKHINSLLWPYPTPLNVCYMINTFASTHWQSCPFFELRASFLLMSFSSPSFFLLSSKWAILIGKENKHHSSLPLLKTPPIVSLDLRTLSLVLVFETNLYYFSSSH